ncbi:endonuclease/exonuclease/phosphatase family protein [Avibacterium paragallinarum]|uniref:endonuclease/exonuclease/phosphatase family protein n=1 Tax=Avibacterium paragallinarum TaxID=728 RepID=UPI0021F71B27|nr:endonuclease/exonuclease/phosphatase family protein [Avibacterium paragallinarum]UXN35548.1 endonuclease/exonuclease/phosphatase family protein [Avibacterium paragallinarum]
MSKLKFFFIALFSLTFMGGGYLWYSLAIFPVPKTQFQTARTLSYQRQALDQSVACFHTNGNIDPITQRDFRLLVWNMHKGQDRGWQEQLKTLAEGKDFLFLQEVSSGQHLDSQFSSQFPTALYTSSFAYLGQQSGVDLLSRFTPRFYCAGASVEPWIRIPKVGNAMAFPLVDGQRLLIINVHLVNFEWNPTHYQQQLTAMFQLLQAHQGPIILAGDFNAWNRGRIDLIQKLTALYGLTPVKFQPDDRLRFFSNPLDWVFVRGFKVKNARTIKTTSSDHNPLLVELAL